MLREDGPTEVLVRFFDSGADAADTRIDLQMLAQQRRYERIRRLTIRSPNTEVRLLDDPALEPLRVAAKPGKDALAERVMQYARKWRSLWLLPCNGPLVLTCAPSGSVDEDEHC